MQYHIVYLYAYNRPKNKSYIFQFVEILMFIYLLGDVKIADVFKVKLGAVST
jgi:hypothetical protein